MTPRAAESYVYRAALGRPIAKLPGTPATGTARSWSTGTWWSPRATPTNTELTGSLELFSVGDRVCTPSVVSWQSSPVPRRASPRLDLPLSSLTMLKLARWSTTHRLYIAIGWVVLLIAVNVLAQSGGRVLLEQLHAAQLRRAARVGPAGTQLPRAGRRPRHDRLQGRARHACEDPAVRTHMSALFAKVSGLPHVSGVISPYAASQAGKAISANGRIAFATVVFNEKANNLPKSAGEEGGRHGRKAARQPGLQIELGGQAIEQTEQEGFGLTTAVGLLAAIVVLLITFGSLIAMGLPIVTALFGLGTGLGLIALFTHVVDTPNFSSELAAMIGLGVGIDYSLFIVTRFREAYATPGPSFGNVRESVVQAMDTAGRAVLFAGCTVVIALLGMMLLGVDFLYGVAISASIGVLLVMLGSLTLLPALLTIAGKRLVRPSRRARRRGVQATDARHGGTWLRWSHSCRTTRGRSRSPRRW